MKRSFELDLKFAIDCKMSSAITWEEFKLWVDKMIIERDDLPGYAYYLDDCKDLSEAWDLIDQMLHSDISEKESDSLDGIGVKRGLVTEDPVYSSDDGGTLSKKTALKRLEQNPHIEKRFREMFPFIEW